MKLAVGTRAPHKNPLFFAGMDVVVDVQNETWVLTWQDMIREGFASQPPAGFRVLRLRRMGAG